MKSKMCIFRAIRERLRSEKYAQYLRALCSQEVCRIDAYNLRCPHRLCFSFFFQLYICMIPPSCFRCI